MKKRFSVVLTFRVWVWIRVSVMESYEIEFLKNPLVETFSNLKFGLSIPVSVCRDPTSVFGALVDLSPTQGMRGAGAETTKAHDGYDL